MTAPTLSRATYSERMWPSAGVWLLAPGLGVLCAFSVVPLSMPGAIAVWVVVTLTVSLLLARTAVLVLVTDGEDPGLRVGRAYLDAWHVGEVTPLDREGTRHVLGPGANALAYLAQRGWIPTSVRVEVRDDADPTPYWVVSSRHPHALAAALEAVRPPNAP